MQTFKRFITEKPAKIDIEPVKPSMSLLGHGDVSIRGLINPSTKREIIQFSKNTKYGEARFILTKSDKEVYVFDADDAIHYEVARANGYKATDYISGVYDYKNGNYIGIQDPHENIEFLKKISRGFRELINDDPGLEITSY